MIGTNVGQYEITGRLGEGGMGTVYLAVHRVLHTRRAVKILLPEWTLHSDIVERFINEARAAAAIHHRNIIGVHDCGQLPTGQWYILLDYLDGATLNGFMRSQGGPLSPSDALHILCEVANGVQAAHDHGIVHRDLKPDNLFLSHRDGDPHFVTILDFGVAKLGERASKVLTGAGAIIGTPAYMAPEQMRGGTVKAAADVFALGVIAYQMVTGGVLPFRAEPGASDPYAHSLIELYQRIISAPPVDPRRHAPRLPEGWVAAIVAALDPDPARRPANPRALALQLAEATPGDGYAPSGLTLVRTYARELLELGSADDTVRAVSESKPAPPAQLSRYQLVRKLGAGGMAEVYLGTVAGADGFSRTIAIKRVLAGFSREPLFAEMFISEAQLASRLTHPNIVAVTDFDRDEEGRPFLVMEFVEGKDLAALLTTGVLPVAVTIFIIAEVLRGLGYAHELPRESGLRGVVHRDVSPHNVLLSWEGAVKVSDFGIAKALVTGVGAASMMVKGKPAYMSPEQANGEALDGRSDLFAVGIMLWEMLTGQSLFRGTAKETIAQVMFAKIAAPRLVRAGVPADVSAVAMRLLARELPNRCACAEDALEELLACADAPRNGPGELAALLAARFSRPMRRKGTRSEGERRGHERAASAPPAASPAQELAALALGVVRVHDELDRTERTEVPAHGYAPSDGPGHAHAPGYAPARGPAYAAAHARDHQAGIPELIVEEPHSPAAGRAQETVRLRQAGAPEPRRAEPAGEVRVHAATPPRAFRPVARARWRYAVGAVAALAGLAGVAVWRLVDRPVEPAVEPAQAGGEGPSLVGAGSAGGAGGAGGAGRSGAGAMRADPLATAPAVSPPVSDAGVVALDAAAAGLASAGTGSGAGSGVGAGAGSGVGTVAGSGAPGISSSAGTASGGTLSLDVVPWAYVWIDNKRVGSTPVHTKLSPGKHRVRITNNYESKTFTVTIVSSRTTVIHQTLQGSTKP